MYTKFLPTVLFEWHDCAGDKAERDAALAGTAVPRLYSVARDGTLLCWSYERKRTGDGAATLSNGGEAGADEQSAAQYTGMSVD